MIDVTFLLLIFFMVSSTFTNQPAIKLVLPRSATAEQSAVTPAIVYLTEAGRVYRRGTLMKLSSDPNTLDNGLVTFWSRRY